METILVAILVIGFLIFVHELRHFLAAKLMKVKVEVFSLGFGPKIIGFTLGETEYRLSAIPLGGYVKLYGEHLETLSSVVEKEKAFAFKKTWQKAFIVIAGPLANFLLPIFIFFLLFYLSGSYISPAKIGEILPNSPAEKAGLKVGDEILEINGKKVKSFEDLILILREKETFTEITLKIRRKDQVFDITLIPEFKEGYNIFGKKTKVPFLGIKSSQEILHQKHGIFESLGLALQKVLNITKFTLIAIYKLFTGDLPFSTLGGPLMIGKMAGETAKLGIYPLLYFTAFLSVNLGIINLLPVPMLDGGHLIIFGIEAIRRKPLSLKTQELIFKIGLVILIFISLVVFYNDLLRLFTGWKNP